MGGQTHVLPRQQTLPAGTQVPPQQTESALLQHHHPPPHSWCRPWQDEPWGGGQSSEVSAHTPLPQQVPCPCGQHVPSEHEVSSDLHLPQVGSLVTQQTPFT